METKKLTFATVLLTFGLLLTTVDYAAAQPHLGAYTGYNLSEGEVFFGAQAQWQVIDESVMFTPVLESAFMEGMTAIQANTNFLYRFDDGGLQDSVVPFAGLGPGLLYRSVGDREELDLGFNVVGGFYFMPQAEIHPFAKARLSFFDETYFNVMGGLMFSL